MRKQLVLYGITDGKLCSGRIEAMVEEAILGGATMIQYREKKLTGEALKKEALQVQAVCRKYDIPFLINDYVELAKEIGADGVHVGADDCSVRNARNILGENAIIGATAKTVLQAQQAEADGANYLGSGAVFGTTTKSDAKPMSLDLLTAITASVAIPVVAIGGIHSENILALQGTGIAGVAVVGGLFGQPCVKTAAEVLREKLTEVLL